MNIHEFGKDSIGIELQAQGRGLYRIVCGIWLLNGHAFSLPACKERGKGRKSDIEYMKRKFPQTKFTILPEPGHAGPALLKPELFAEMICGLE